MYTITHICITNESVEANLCVIILPSVPAVYTAPYNLV